MYSHSISVPSGVVTGCKQIVVGILCVQVSSNGKMSFAILLPHFLICSSFAVGILWLAFFAGRFLLAFFGGRFEVGRFCGERFAVGVLRWVFCDGRFALSVFQLLL